jgi:tetratricopeptide (TPR) repeat protein
MNRIILTGALALAIGVPGLFAQPKPKSKGEVEALQAMFNAQTPDARIAAAENVLEKYKDTDFKSVALYFEAASYEQKGDYEHAVVFGERTLDTDPKNYQAMLLLARQIAQHTKEFDLDKEDKLAKVDKYAKNALDIVKDAPKPRADVTDEQWTAAKKEFEGEAHEALGIAALVRKKPDVAVTEFKTAMTDTDKPDPGIMVRLGIAYSQDGKYDDAIAMFDKVMAMPDINPQFRQYAQAERVRAFQKKNPKPAAAPATAPNGTAPATPGNPATPANPTPPQPDVKKQ